MRISKTSTAAFLAGATTLAVTLPAFAQERSYDLSGFDQLEISSGLLVEVEIGPDFTVTAQAGTRRMLNRLDIRVRGGTLIVSRDKSWSDMSLFALRQNATIKVTLPQLTVIEASTGSDVSVSGQYGDSLRAEIRSGAELDLENVSGTSLRFSASSGSDLRAEGSCAEVQLNSSGGASIDARDLLCAEVRADASSGSNIRAFATEAATATASSGGGVHISGEPDSVQKRESSGGNVRML